MRVLVCGGRDLTDAAWVADRLGRLHAKRPITLLVHGAAPGADLAAELWARSAQVDYHAYPARWRADGPTSAGPRRNQRMLDAERDGLELVVAFPGGRGTADMVRRAAAAGVRIWEPGPRRPV